MLYKRLRHKSKLKILIVSTVLNSLKKIFSRGKYGHHNAAKGNWEQCDSERNIIYSSGSLVALVGVKDLAVIVTDDVVLVCDRSRSQEIRGLTEKLEAKGLEAYL